MILRPQGVESCNGDIAGDLVAIIKLHAVHDQSQRATGQHLLTAQFHVHWQCRFQGCVPVAACGIGLIAANADQPDSEIPDCAFEQFHQVATQVPRSDVAKKDGIIALHLGECAREAVYVRDFHLHVS